MKKAQSDIAQDIENKILVLKALRRELLKLEVIIDALSGLWNELGLPDYDLAVCKGYEDPYLFLDCITVLTPQSGVADKADTKEAKDIQEHGEEVSEERRFSQVSRGRTSEDG